MRRTQLAGVWMFGLAAVLLQPEALVAAPPPTTMAIADVVALAQDRVEQVEAGDDTPAPPGDETTGVV
ncbi:MAG: hypothetical protein IAG13_23790, partial [Deltaproteobacteria bacterium]|nr:hypothetical protein [Nannocystaceae bacterium]